MAKIEGPNGTVTDVDEKNRLSVFSVSRLEDKSANEEGRYWSLFVSVTPTGASDNFFYLRNDGVKNLSITDIRVSCSAITQLLYKHVTGTPVGGAAIVPKSRILGSPKVPSAIIEQGADITGLTDLGTPLFFEECDIPNRRENMKATSTIIIPQGQAIAFERVAATGAITMIVSLSEEE
jgi:hypothetical protein